MTHESATKPARVTMRVTLQLELSVDDPDGVVTILSAVDAALDTGELQQAIMDGGVGRALRLDSLVVQSAQLGGAT